MQLAGAASHAGRHARARVRMARRVAAGGSAQRLRLAKVDDVEPVRLAHLGAGGAEIVPLRVAARAVIPVQQQVVLVTVDMHRTPQVAALKARLEEQRAAGHLFHGGGHEDHRVVHDSIEHLPGFRERPASLLRLEEHLLPLAGARRREQRLYARWRR